MKKPRIMVEVGPHGRLRPVAPYDEAVLNQTPRGRTFELVATRTGRSNPQIKLYWGVLHAVVDATGTWPDAEALHEELVVASGFVRPILNPFSGRFESRRDSVAFDAMDQDRFNLFMTTALAKLSEALGIDVLDLLPPKDGAA